MALFILYVQKRTCAYQGEKLLVYRKKVSYVPNEWSLFELQYLKGCFSLFKMALKWTGSLMLWFTWSNPLKRRVSWFFSYYIFKVNIHGLSCIRLIFNQWHCTNDGIFHNVNVMKSARVSLHSMKKSFMRNFIFCAV